MLYAVFVGLYQKLLRRWKGMEKLFLNLYLIESLVVNFKFVYRLLCIES